MMETQSDCLRIDKLVGSTHSTNPTPSPSPTTHSTDSAHATNPSITTGDSICPSPTTHESPTSNPTSRESPTTDSDPTSIQSPSPTAVTPTTYEECAGLIGNILSIYLDKICVRFTVSTLMEKVCGKKLNKYYYRILKVVMIQIAKV